MRPRAFTLIELLVVVAIIAILAAVALPSFLDAQTRAKVSRVRADLRTVAAGLEAYRADNGAYPGPAAGVWPLVLDGQFNRNLRPLTTPVAFLTSLPQDTFNGGHCLMMPWAQPGPNTFDYFTHDADVLHGSRSDAEWRVAFGSSQWKLTSPGPDLVYQDTSSDFGFRDRYDPTNGTRSGGDIVRSQALTL